MNWTDLSGELARWSQERKARLATERKVLRETLTSLGVMRIEARYDGYGDSGNVEEIVLTPEAVTLEDGLHTKLADFLWSVAYDLHPGFENTDGGDGEITWDLTENKIDLEHRERFTDYNTYSHEGV